MRKLFGFLAFVLGLVGFAACALGVIAAWRFKEPATASGLEALAGLDEALTTGAERLGVARTAVKTIDDAVMPAVTMVTKLAELAGKTSPEDEKGIERVRAEVLRKLDQLEGFVQLSRTAVDVLNRATKSAKNLPLLGKQVDSVAEHATDAGNTLAELSEFLKKLHNELETIRTAKEVRQDLAEKIVNIAVQVDNKLGRMQGRLQGMADAVDEIRSDVAEVRANLATWLWWAALAITVLLVWVALAQWALMVAGIRWMRSRRSTSS